MSDRDTYTIPNVEIFAVGKHHGFPFDEAVVAQLVADTNAQLGREPFLRVGHGKGDKPNDGEPRAGTLANLRYHAGKVIADFLNVPAAVYKAIQNGALPKRSVELVRDYRDKAGNVMPWVLDSVALLGTAHPEVKDLRDIGAIYAAEDGLTRLVIETGASWQEEIKMTDTVPIIEEVVEEIVEEPEGAGAETPDAETDEGEDTKELDDLREKNAELEARIAELTKDEEDERGERTEMAERIAKLEARNDILRLHDKIPPAERKEAEAKLLKLRKVDGEMKFSETDALAPAYIAELEGRTAMRFGEDGGPGDGPEKPGKPTAEQLKRWEMTEEKWDGLSEEFKESILS